MPNLQVVFRTKGKKPALNGNAVNVEKATDRIHRLLEIVEPIQGAPFYPIAVQECIQVLFLLVKCPLDFGDLEPIRQAARIAYYNIPHYNIYYN